MADAKATIIIKKKRGGGHGAAHGGAWKVAFADFMTAMMTFFLVMWLLGSDEEIQSSVAEYFNNPASAWRPDLASKQTVPLGERTGAGENVLSGINGLVPEDIIERPSREYKQAVDAEQKDTEKEVDQTEHGLRPPVKIELEVLKFSIPEYMLFVEGTDQLTPKAEKALESINKLLLGFKGRLTVQAATTPSPGPDAAIADPYQFSLTRAVAVQQYLIKKRVIDETRIKAFVASAPAERNTASDDDAPVAPAGPRKIQFILK